MAVCCRADRLKAGGGAVPWWASVRLPAHPHKGMCVCALPGAERTRTRQAVCCAQGGHCWEGSNCSKEWGTGSPSGTPPMWSVPMSACDRTNCPTSLLGQHFRASCDNLLGDS